MINVLPGEYVLPIFLKWKYSESDNDPWPTPLDANIITRAGKINGPLQRSAAGYAVGFGFLNVTEPICGPLWYGRDATPGTGWQFGSTFVGNPLMLHAKRRRIFSVGSLNIHRSRFNGLPAA